MILFGYLFNWNGFNKKGNPALDNAEIAWDAINEVPQFQDVTDKQGVRIATPTPEKWKIINFRSSQPLAGEEQEGRMLKDYEYRVFVRVNHESQSLVFASSRYKISDAAVTTFNTYVVPKLQRRHIRVAELSERLFMQKSTTDYYVTFFLADVPDGGTSLRTISLMGDDIAAAGFFDMQKEDKTKPTARRGIPFSGYTARQIGLRPTNSLVECGRFGGNGSIQFPEEAIQELEEFLVYANV